MLCVYLWRVMSYIHKHGSVAKNNTAKFHADSLSVYETITIDGTLRYWRTS